MKFDLKLILNFHNFEYKVTLKMAEDIKQTWKNQPGYSKLSIKKH